LRLPVPLSLSLLVLPISSKKPSNLTSKTALIRLTEILAMETAELGVKVFAIEPGTVRTAMAEFALESAEGKRWLPWLRDVFEKQQDVPAERPARLVSLLASGKADALSGRFFTVHDDHLGLIERAHTADIGDMGTLRLAGATGGLWNLR
jgi:hypothetical protein